jgi:hypothetical protein
MNEGESEEQDFRPEKVEGWRCHGDRDDSSWGRFERSLAFGWECVELGMCARHQVNMSRIESLILGAGHDHEFSHQRSECGQREG